MPPLCLAEVAALTFVEAAAVHCYPRLAHDGALPHLPRHNVAALRRVRNRAYTVVVSPPPSPSAPHCTARARLPPWVREADVGEQSGHASPLITAGTRHFAFATLIRRIRRGDRVRRGGPGGGSAAPDDHAGCDLASATTGGQMAGTGGADFCSRSSP